MEMVIESLFHLMGSSQIHSVKLSSPASPSVLQSSFLREMVSSLPLQRPLALSRIHRNCSALKGKLPRSRMNSRPQSESQTGSARPPVANGEQKPIGWMNAESLILPSSFMRGIRVMAARSPQLLELVTVPRTFLILISALIASISMRERKLTSSRKP
ncbi:hypothetical protein QTG54_012660 [Skeletonema marinoi]|uniref:Uncharacterized protein n=1 Tax=Skeletonema marinoi TaxID=267567 RepID=A0AAD8Y017_9STRA|nr:hypothetical protein QTG54_012660 [Skeletonema marinoi]